MSPVVRRRRRWGLAALAGMGAVLVFTIGASFAFHVGTVAFELDGNVSGEAAPGLDWAEVFDADGEYTGVALPAGTGTFLDEDFTRDFVVGASGPDSSYHEPSNKDDQPILANGPSSVWGCTSVNNPTDKDDILNAYAIAYAGAGDDAGDLIVSFGVERFDDSGTAYLGFWLFQADVTCNTATGKFEGQKTDNDTLLLVNFSNGGDNITINAFAWHPDPTNPTTAAGSFTTIGTGVNCEATTDNDGDPTPGAGAVDMCAITNGTGVDENVSVPWPSEDKTKPGPPNPDPANVLEPPEFVEGAINLSDAFEAAGVTDPPACFGSFMAETRSADTLTATLKDFALGDLQTCDAKITISPTETNRVGEQHVFTVDVEQNTGSGFVAAPTGDVSWTLTGANGIGAGDIQFDAAASTCDDDQDPGPAEDNLDGNGQCTIVVNSQKTGTITASATVAVDLGGGSALTRSTDGTGSNGSPAVKTYVDAALDIAGDGTNRVGANHDFTVTAWADDGDGSGLHKEGGVLVTVSFAEANGTDPIADKTCTTSSVAGTSFGTCSVTFTSTKTGTHTGTASATVNAGPSGGQIGIPVTTAADSTTAGAADALKTWVDAEIDITGDDTNRVNDPHTFTVTLKTDAGDGNGLQPAQGVAVTVALADSDGAVSVVDDDPDTTSTCDDGTDASGQCIVVFTSASTGTVTGTASATVTVGGISFLVDTSTDASVAANQDATKVFVDARIGIAGTDTNSIGEEHTFTITVEKDPGDGYVAAAGVDVDVVLTDALGAVHILDTSATTCDVDAESHDGAGTDQNGQCVVVFTSNSAGTVTASASATVAIGPVNAPVATGDGTSTTGTTVVKTFVAGSLTWVKHDHHGELLPGATFTVCLTELWDSDLADYVDVTDDCHTITDDSDGTDGPAAAWTDQDGTGGEFKLTNLVLGTYTIAELTPPPGWAIVDPNHIETVSLSLVSPNGSAAAPFVNVRLFRLIVITCDDVTDELVDGTVTLDGTSLETISAADLAALGWLQGDSDPLTEQDICTMGGASFGDLDEGTYTPDVEVPDLDPYFP